MTNGTLLIALSEGDLVDYHMLKTFGEPLKLFVINNITKRKL